MLRTTANLTANATRGFVSASSAPRQVLIGPAVRLLLQDYQIDPQQLKPSGPKGNVLKSDVLAHISRSKLTRQSSSSSKPPQKHPDPTAQFYRPPVITSQQKPVGSQKRPRQQKYEDIPLGEQKRPPLTEAHYSLTSELVVDDLLSELDKFDLKAQKVESKQALFDDFVRKASAEACRRVPEAHIVIEPFVSISRNIVESERNEGRLHSHEFQVSNLGTYESVDHFMPVSQPHAQTYTLAVGSEKKRVVLGEDGIKNVTTVKFTLSCDHRAVDTHLTAQWFKHFKRFIEHPNTIFL